MADMEYEMGLGGRIPGRKNRLHEALERDPGAFCALRERPLIEKYGLAVKFPVRLDHQPFRGHFVKLVKEEPGRAEDIFHQFRKTFEKVALHAAGGLF